MNCLAQRGNLDGAMRVVRQDGFAGGGHRPIHDPIVAAWFGEARGTGGLVVNADDLRPDIREVEAGWTGEGNGRIDRKNVPHAGYAKLTDCKDSAPCLT